MTTYLVTGGAGFIGSHIVQTLVEKGENVKIIDNLTTGNKKNIREVINEVQIFEGDVHDYQLVEKACRGVDIIFHQAAVSSVPKSIKDPILTHQVNATGTLHVLQAAVNQGVKRVINASSSSVYGNTSVIPITENSLLCPLSPYAATKLAGEVYCKIFTQLYGLETISLRYFNVFGPRQDPASEYAAVIPRFIRAMLQDKSPVIFGDGTQSRDFIYVSNVVMANLEAAHAPKLNGEAINIGYGKGMSVILLVDWINHILGKQLPSTYTDERIGDVKHSLASIRHAAEIIGYEPLTTFEEGLAQTIKWLQQQL